MKISMSYNQNNLINIPSLLCCYDLSVQVRIPVIYSLKQNQIVQIIQDNRTYVRSSPPIFPCTTSYLTFPKYNVILSQSVYKL